MLIEYPNGVKLFPVAILLFFHFSLLVAQTSTATLVGTVDDPSGSAVPNAKIAIQNLANQARREFTTSTSGDYRFPFLQPGEYSITVEATGFSTKFIKQVTLGVNQTARVDISLELGQSNQVVEISELVPLLNSETSSLGQVIESKQILDLPLNGRQFLELALLVPGVTTGNGGPQNGQSSLFQRPGQDSSISVSGGRAQNNNYLLDGVTNTDGNVNAYIISPSVEAIQEFKVETSNYSAEFGRSSSGQINLISKSGSNQIRGSAYHFLRNNALDARPFNTPNQLPKFRFNQFGAALGGPVLKDRTFFFWNYEGFRRVQGQSRVSSVPPAAPRTGNFAGFPAIHDPTTLRPDSSDPTGRRQVRDPFPNGIIPRNRFNAIADRTLTALVPQANLAGRVNNLLDEREQRQRNNQGTLRLDQRLGSRGLLFGRYSLSNETGFVPTSLPGSGTLSAVRAVHAVIGHTQSITPNIANELRLGYGRLRLERLSENAFRRDIVGELGIPGVQFGGPQVWGVPSFSIAGYTALGDDNFFLPMRLRNNTYHLVNNLSWTRGRHNLKMGGEVRHFQFNIIQIFTPRGDFRFNANFTNRFAGTQTGADPTGDALASFLLGLPFQQRRTVGTANAYLRQNSFAGYFQDDWKLTSTLTLNFGIRYEFNSPFYDKFDRLSNVSMKSIRTLTALRPEDFGRVDVPVLLAGRNGTPRGLTSSDYNNWGPRGGVAWRPRERWVIRAGTGLFYGSQDGEHYGRTSINVPFVVSDIQDSDAFIPQIPSIGFTIPPQIGGNTLRNVFVGIDENLRTPYSVQWNAALQRQLTSAISLETAYVGSVSHKLDTRNAYNDAPPATGGLDGRRPHQRLLLPDLSSLPPGILPAPVAGSTILAGTIENQVNRVSANYHAMHAKIQYRSSSGISGLVAYTWAKAISDGNSYRRQGSQGELAQDFLNVSERALTGFDVRNRLVANFVYQIPFCRTSATCFGGSAARLLLGGWQWNGIFQAQTGFPFTVLLANATANNGRATRANVVAGQSGSLPSDERSAGRFFNTSAFSAPAPFTLGNSGVNNVTGPALWSADTSLHKNFAIGERFSVQFRSEFFNVFNHPSLATPNSLLGVAQFGTVTAQSIPPRQVQFALKLLF